MSSTVIVRAALTASFLDQRYIADYHAPICALGHVIHRNERDGDCDDRLHLDAGTPRGTHLRLRHDPREASIGRELDLNVLEQERMAKRNEVRRSLGGHHAC